VLHVRLRDPAQREQARLLLGERLGVPVNVEADATSLVAQVSDPGRAAAALSELGAANIGISDFSLGQPSLDEVFFALTGHPAEAAGEDAVPAAAGQRSAR
jgi:ABC-2 type transport system ATP-binding protein